MEYRRLCALYDAVQSTPKRLEKTFHVAQFLKEVPEEELECITLLLQGRVFPAWSEKKIGVASQLVLKALNVATGIALPQIEDAWRETGDLGEAAFLLVGKKKQVPLFQQPLTVQKVFANLQNLASTEGQGSVDRKIKGIAELLTSATPIEAKYVVRSVLEELRVGIGDSTMRDALVWAYLLPEIPFKDNDLALDDREAYNVLIEKAQHAFNLTNDFAQVALLIRKGQLDDIALHVDTPVKVMLFMKAQSIEDAFERVGKPCAFEFKYDGFRVQIHKHGGEVKLFSRRLDEVTLQFPEVGAAVAAHVNSTSCILDAEVVGFDPVTKKHLPFQKVSQRIKRKHGIAAMAKELPVEIKVFDVLVWDDEMVIEKPFAERRALLEKGINQEPFVISLSESLVTDDAAKAQQFYEQSLKDGQEGLMAKNLSAAYKPGNRVGHGVKIKGVMDALDLVIVGAEWGEGKRAGWLTSFTLACQDESNLVEIGKVGTGIKEKPEEGLSFGQLTELLKPLIIKEEGRTVFVKPQIVISLHYEEIQKSPTYGSGYALRFPRVVGLREDKPVNEIATLEEVEELYFSQRGR